MSIRIPRARHAPASDETLRAVASLTPARCPTAGPRRPGPGAAASARQPVPRIATGRRLPVTPSRACRPAGTSVTPTCLPAHACCATDSAVGRLIHVEQIAARPGIAGRLARLGARAGTEASGARGIAGPWPTRPRPTHARAGRHVIISTGTASGKSLGYLLPALTGLLEGGDRALPRADQGPGRGPARAPSPGWGCPACAPPCWTATPAPRSGTGPGSTPTTCSPTRTCCTACCSRSTAAGPGSCAGCATSSSTSATPTAACSAPTSRRCCAGCAGSPRTLRRRPPVFVLASATAAEPGAHRAAGSPACRVRRSTDGRLAARARCRSRCGSRR